MKRIKSFFSLSPKEKLLFFEALVFQYVTWMLLLILPFRRIVRLFPNRQTPEQNADKTTLERIRAATAQANNLALWKNRCLVQALAARWMLSRRGIPSKLSLGVTLDDNKKVIAHAWIMAGDLEIVARGGDYTELYSY